MRDLLRDVNLDGYRLQTWDTGRTRDGKTVLEYRFTAPDGVVVFDGADFYCSPIVAIDSDDCLRALLGFLTLRPGDTDREHFETYTETQMDFARGDAEYLAIWSMEEGHPGFTDWQ